MPAPVHELTDDTARSRNAPAHRLRPGRTALVWLAGLRALVAVALLAPLAAFTAGQGKLSLAAWLGLLPVVPLASSGLGLLLGERISARLLALQFWADALVVLAVVWSTGGLLSAYTPLMLLPVAGRQRDRRTSRRAAGRRGPRIRRRGARGGPVRLVASAVGAA